MCAIKVTDQQYKEQEYNLKFDILNLNKKPQIKELFIVGIVNKYLFGCIMFQREKQEYMLQEGEESISAANTQKKWCKIFHD